MARKALILISTLSFINLSQTQSNQGPSSSQLKSYLQDKIIEPQQAEHQIPKSIQIKSNNQFQDNHHKSNNNKTFRFNLSQFSYKKKLGQCCLIASQLSKDLKLTFQEDIINNQLLVITQFPNSYFSLKHHRKSNAHFSLKDLLTIHVQILSIVQQYHSNQIIHTQITEENIFLDQNKNQVLLAIFALPLKTLIINNQLLQNSFGSPSYIFEKEIQFGFFEDLWQSTQLFFSQLATQFKVDWKEPLRAAGLLALELIQKKGNLVDLKELKDIQRNLKKVLQLLKKYIFEANLSKEEQKQIKNEFLKELELKLQKLVPVDSWLKDLTLKEIDVLNQLKQIFFQIFLSDENYFDQTPSILNKYINLLNQLKEQEPVVKQKQIPVRKTNSTVLDKTFDLQQMKFDQFKSSNETPYFYIQTQRQINPKVQNQKSDEQLKQINDQKITSTSEVMKYQPDNGSSENIQEILLNYESQEKKELSSKNNKKGFQPFGINGLEEKLEKMSYQKKPQEIIMEEQNECNEQKEDYSQSQIKNKFVGNSKEQKINTMVI